MGRRILNNLCKALFLRRWNITAHSLSMNAHGGPFQRKQYGKRKERVTLQWRKLTNATSVRWSRSTSRVKPTRGQHLDMLKRKWHSVSKVFLPNHVAPNSSWEKHQTNLNEGHSRKTPTISTLLKMTAVIKYRKGWRSESKEPKETLITKCNAVFWMAFLKRKGKTFHLGKNWETWIKYEFNNNVLKLVQLQKKKKKRTILQYEMLLIGQIGQRVYGNSVALYLEFLCKSETVLKWKPIFLNPQNSGIFYLF